MTKPEEDAVIDIANEFGAVRVSVSRSGNGPRLVIRDLGSLGEIALDPFTLAQLVWLTQSELEGLSDPQRVIDGSLLAAERALAQKN